MSTYKIEITNLAEEEYSSAFHYYEALQTELGDKFEKETEYLMDKLKVNPYLFQRKYKHYREAVFKKFPYCIVYEIIGNLVAVRQLAERHLFYFFFSIHFLAFTKASIQGETSSFLSG